ncbi:MAG: hypothetical protein RLZ98_2627 [Pseudomonadota bacterium]
MPQPVGFRTEMDFEYGVAREIVPGVARIVANNPGPYTFKGTNTYLIGTRTLALIDPGPEDEAHVDAICRAVAGRRVTHILITHRHRDHTGATARLKERIDAPVYAFGPVTFAPPRSAGGNSGSVDKEFPADILLRDGETLAGEGWTMDVLHTPGHLCDHICFRLREAGVLFSGDHVMGWNTSVVAPPNGSMAEYLASLDKVRDLDVTIHLPGHGGRVPEPRRHVKALQLHRQWREEAIVSSLERGRLTIEDIVADVYQGLDERLLRAASLSVEAHVEHLAARGRVNYAAPLTFSTLLSLAKP